MIEVPYESLHMPGTFVGHVRRNPALDGFLPRRAESAADLLATAADRLAFEGHDAWRADVARALRDYAVRLDAPAAVCDAARRLGRPGTVAVVTGQQPGLFGGPLYVWHKVATALRLARELRACAAAPDVVTVFWNHSDDHDWGEANHCFLVNPALDIQRVRLRLPTTGRALCDIEVGDEVARAIEEARDLLAPTAAQAEELDALRPVDANETLGTLTARLLFRHFGNEGLLVLEPAALPAEMREPLRAMHARAPELRAAYQATSTDLVDHGFDVTVDPEAPFMFALTPGGKRGAVPDGEECPASDLPSPGVLLRNLWQDTLLPTLAYVAGPGEVAYLALSQRLYAICGLPRPSIVARASLTHVEPRLAADLERWSLGLGDLEVEAGALESKIAQTEGVEEHAEADELPEDRLLQIAEEFRRALRAAEPNVSAVDPKLCHPLARIGLRASSDVKKFVTKLDNQRRNQAGRFRQHARRLCAELRPRGRLQERVLPALPFVARRPDSFVRMLIDVASPFADGHLLIVPPA